jgi:hypothetical protein
MKYTDNMDFPTYIKLVVMVNYTYGQSMAYFDRCAKRMARYSIKNKALKDWPAHIRDKYHFVQVVHTSVPNGDIHAPRLSGVIFSS